MNARTRLKRELVRHRGPRPIPHLRAKQRRRGRSHPRWFQPTYTRFTTTGGVPVRVTHPYVTWYGTREVAYILPRTYVSGVFPPTRDVFDEIHYVAGVWCWTCEDWGRVEIFHHSTDGLIGWRNCPDLRDPRRHPPVKPAPPAAPATITHLPGCTDASPLADCCPPF